MPRLCRLGKLTDFIVSLVAIVNTLIGEARHKLIFVSCNPNNRSLALSHQLCAINQMSHWRLVGTFLATRSCRLAYLEKKYNVGLKKMANWLDQYQAISFSSLLKWSRVFNPAVIKLKSSSLIYAAVKWSDSFHV